MRRKQNWPGNWCLTPITASADTKTEDVVSGVDIDDFAGDAGGEIRAQKSDNIADFFLCYGTS